MLTCAFCFEQCDTVKSCLTPQCSDCAEANLLEPTKCLPECSYDHGQDSKPLQVTNKSTPDYSSLVQAALANILLSALTQHQQSLASLYQHYLNNKNLIRLHAELYPSLEKSLTAVAKDQSLKLQDIQFKSQHVNEALEFCRILVGLVEPVGSPASNPNPALTQRLFLTYQFLTKFTPEVAQGLFLPLPALKPMTTLSRQVRFETVRELDEIDGTISHYPYAVVETTTINTRPRYDPEFDDLLDLSGLDRTRLAGEQFDRVLLDVFIVTANHSGIDLVDLDELRNPTGCGTIVQTLVQMPNAQHGRRYYDLTAQGVIYSRVLKDSSYKDGAKSWANFSLNTLPVKTTGFGSFTKPGSSAVINPYSSYISEQLFQVTLECSYRDFNDLQFRSNDRYVVVIDYVKCLITCYDRNFIYNSYTSVTRADYDRFQPKVRWSFTLGNRRGDGPVIGDVQIFEHYLVLFYNVDQTLQWYELDTGKLCRTTKVELDCNSDQIDVSSLVDGRLNIVTEYKYLSTYSLDGKLQYRVVKELPRDRADRKSKLAIRMGGKGLFLVVFGRFGESPIR